MPLTWGILRPVVLLPEGAREWPPARLRSVLLHELVHVERLDLLAQAIAQAACCLYWFHPLAWMAARQLRKERERACDDLVLSAGARPVTYADQLLEIARSSVYAVPQPIAAAELTLMRQLDELHVQRPFAGSRLLRDLLRLRGVIVGRKHVATLMRRMRIEALYQRPRTTRPHPGHTVFPYLLRAREITAPNQVWAMDITYIPMSRGFVYLFAVVDWAANNDSSIPEAIK